MAITVAFSNGIPNPVNPASSYSLAIPAGVLADDILVLANVSTVGTDPGVVDNDAGGNAWVKKAGGGGASQATLWWKRATAGTAGKTISVSGLVTKGRGGLVVYRGGKKSGDPFNQLTGHQAHSAGSETHSLPFTPTVDGCWIGLAVYTPVATTTTTGVSCTNPGALPTRVASGDANTCALIQAGQLQATAASTGNFVYDCTPNTDSITIAYALAPEPDAPVAPTVASVSPNNGPTTGGTAVTITGTGFTGATAAAIGGAPVTSLVVVNATTITCVTPAYGAAGTYNVTVTTPAGTGVGSNVFSYTHTPITGTLAATEVRDTAAMAGSVFNYMQSVQARVADAAVGTRKQNLTLQVPTDQEFDITGDRQWTPADFRDGAFSIYLGSHNADAPAAGHWDCTSVRVTYVLPPNRTGELVAVEAPDGAAFVGTVQSAGALAATEAADVAAFVGAVVAHGALAAIEAADAAAFAGTVGSTGILAASEAADVAAFVGIVTTPVTGILAAVEAPDFASFVGEGLPVTGTLVAVEAADAAAFAGIVASTGVLAAVEAPDTAAMAGKVSSTGALVASEAPDVAALAGTVAWKAILAAVEASDTAAMVGTVASPAVAGILAAVEAPDTAAFSGAIVVTGVLVAVEAPDVAFFTSITIEGILAAVEASDTALFRGGGDFSIDIVGDEDPHPIHGGCEGVPAITGSARPPTIKGSI